MNYFPSPPSSPVILSATVNKVICGSCDKPLSNDWFCSDCHIKCNICNRFLSYHEQCSRCWLFNDTTNCYVRKEYHHYHYYPYYPTQHFIASPPPSFQNDPFVEP
ncbi:hypothetical protein BDB01DRAFT_830615 [Pilobolus umbonatus]|nr:hypothetical protein BDB01DRAFT_830615 [Pilobolus umbonatus]